MTTEQKQEIERELGLATLMVKDLQKLWSSYSKKALIAKEERELRQEKKGFMDCENEYELMEAYGSDYIDEETYRRGLDYFENAKKPPTLSVVETHRKRIREYLDLWKGTVNERNEELCANEKQPEEDIFDKLARTEREDHYRTML